MADIIARAMAKQNTASLADIAQYLVKTPQELYNALLAVKALGKGDITLLDRTYNMGSVVGTFPIDLSDTSIRLHGKHPIISAPAGDPDLSFTISGGTIIDGGGRDLFIGNRLNGALFEDIAFINCGNVLNFGEYDQIGMSFSTLKNLYAYNCTGTFIKLCNIQHVYGERLNSRKVLKGLHILNWHTKHSGPNSIFIDVYCEPNPPASGIYAKGCGIELESKGVLPLAHCTFIRPQVNAMLISEANYGIGSNFYLNGTVSTISCITIIGGDLEGYVETSLEGVNVVDSNIDLNIAFGKYAVKLSHVGTPNPSQQNNIKIASAERGVAGYGLISSDSYRNFFMGRCYAVEGQLSGMMWVEGLNGMVLYSDNPTTNGIMARDISTVSAVTWACVAGSSLGNQAFTANVEATLQFDVSNKDGYPVEMHDRVVNNSRIKIYRTGLYLVDANIMISNKNEVSKRTLAIKKNGTTVLTQLTINSSGTVSDLMHLNAFVLLTNGDYLEVTVLSGFDTNLLNSSTYPKFTVSEIK